MMARKTKPARGAKRKAPAKAAKRKLLRANATIKQAAAKSAKRAARGAPIRRASAGRAAPRRKASDHPILHGLFLSLPSCKVGLTLTMMGVPFEYRHVDLMKGQHKTPGFLALNRFGQVPVLEHAGHVLCQSNVILQYLAAQFGKFGGKSESERLRVAEWLAWDFDRLQSGLGGPRAFAKFFPQPDDVVRYHRARGDAALDTLDRHLGQSKFLAGASPTIADIAAFPWIATADEGGFDLARWPNVQAWAERFMRLPGAAHPYNVMPKEDRAIGS
jgi:glutathione S-transferase